MLRIAIANAFVFGNKITIFRGVVKNCFEGTTSKVCLKDCEQRMFC